MTEITTTRPRGPVRRLPNMVQVMIRMEPQQREDLAYLAVQTGASVAEIVRRAIAREIERLSHEYPLPPIPEEE